MRTLIALCLLSGLAAAEGGEFSAFTVVFYHVDEAVEAGVPVERTRSLILTDVEEVTIGGAPFLAGTVPDGVGSSAPGARVHIRTDRVYLLMGSDNNRAAKILSESADKGIWRQVDE